MKMKEFGPGCIPRAMPLDPPLKMPQGFKCHTLFPVPFLTYELVLMLIVLLSIFSVHVLIFYLCIYEYILQIYNSAMPLDLPLKMPHGFKCHTLFLVPVLTYELVLMLIVLLFIFSVHVLIFYLCIYEYILQIYNSNPSYVAFVF